MPTFNQLKSAANEIERANELSKTPGGREVLKNIAKANLLRLFDRTQIYDQKAKLDVFRNKFKDIVRPNRFEIEFGLDQKVEGKAQKSLINFHSTYLCKSLTIPSIKTNKMEFKRAGKTIKIPLNTTMDDSPIDITFYHDANNVVLGNLFTLLNTNQYQYHNQFIETSAYLSLQYVVSMRYGEGSDYGLLDKAADFFDIGLFNSFEDSGSTKQLEALLPKHYNDKILEFKFNNIFFSEVNGFEWDMEKIDTFGEIRCQIDFTGFEFNIWDMNKKYSDDFPSKLPNSTLLDDEAIPIVKTDEIYTNRI